MKQKDENLNPHCGPFQGSGIVWSDDRTEVYTGDCQEITSQQIVSQTHNTSENFEFNANCCEYLYFVSWSNDWGQNGLLVQLQGDGKIYSGHQDWEVFATGINKNVGTGATNSVTIAEINQQLKRACKKGWKKPFVGQKNNGTTKPKRKPFNKVTGIDANAQFIWHNSTKDQRNLYPSSPYVPFEGYNHDEFLIFRLPLKTLFVKRCGKCECESCDCSCSNGCDGCNENAKVQNKALVQRAMKKYNTIPHGIGCAPYPFERMKCEKVIGLNKEILPCIYLHWGDSTRDTIENHDTEIVYITVCNPFEDVEFTGFRITKINFVPAPSASHQARIVPDSFINYDCLEPCTCKTREFTLLTRDELNKYVGIKHIEIEYCWDELVIKKHSSYGAASFKIDIVKDEE